MTPYDPRLALRLAEAAVAVYRNGEAFASWARPRRYASSAWSEGSAQAAVLARSGEDAEVVVALRGSDDRIDWNINASFLRVRRTWWGGAVHRGFTRYAERLAPLITEEVARWPNRPVRVVGHSLGGALALLLAHHLSRSGRPVDSVHAFCAPRVGDRAWAKAYDAGPLGPVTFRVVVVRHGQQDLVTLLPPAALGFWHAGRPEIIVDGRRYETEAAWDEVRAAGPGKWRLLSRLLWSVGAHPGKFLLAALHQNCELERRRGG